MFWGISLRKHQEIIFRSTRNNLSELLADKAINPQFRIKIVHTLVLLLCWFKITTLSLLSAENLSVKILLVWILCNKKITVLNYTLKSLWSLLPHSAFITKRETYGKSRIIDNTYQRYIKSSVIIGLVFSPKPQFGFHVGH